MPVPSLEIPYQTNYETVVTASQGSIVFPLLASGDTASTKEFASFDSKIDQLPEDTENVLADTGYDKNDFGDRIEYDEQGHRTGRRFICPPNRRNSTEGRISSRRRTKSTPSACRSRRQKRIAFYRSRRGQKFYTRRCQTVEPFNDWFKALFELDERVWHRGLDNNRTQMLAAIFGYQLLVRYNHRRGRENGQIKWILDQL